MCPDEVEAVVEPPPLELGEPQLLLAAAAGRVHQLYQGPSDVEGEERGGGGLAGEEDGRAAVAGVGADLRAGEVDLAAHCSTDRRPPRGSRAHLAAVPRLLVAFDCRAWTLRGSGVVVGRQAASWCDRSWALVGEQ